jgi:creatinine amidohydrolase
VRRIFDGLAMLPKRLWTDMTWEDFRSGDVERWIAVLPIAAVEQHGPHLPVGVDTYIAEGYLARVMKLLPDGLPVTFLPTQTIGKSNEHIEFPGTLTLSAETAIRAWTEIGESVHRAGVKKLVIVNSHGGNSPIMDLVSRNLRVSTGMFVVNASWSRFGYPTGLFTDAERIHGIHAGDIETSLMLAFREASVKKDKFADFTPSTLAMEKEFSKLRSERPAGFAWLTQDLNPAGGVGNAKLASMYKGEQAADFGARAFIELLQDVDRFDLKRLKKGPLDS